MKCSSRFPSTIVRSKDVHVWRLHLDQLRTRFNKSFDILSEDEQHRALRFHFALDRERFVLARAGLRTVLSHYTGISPKHLRFSYSRYGKPILCDDGDSSGSFAFNLSHSEDLALIGITRGEAIGIDVEYCRDNAMGENIIEDIFSSAEIAAFRALPDSQHKEAFFTYWTCKEAYIKGQGEGFSFPLKSFDVVFSDDGRQGVCLRTRPDFSEGEAWTIKTLHPSPFYKGALAIRMSHPNISCRAYPAVEDPTA